MGVVVTAASLSTMIPTIQPTFPVGSMSVRTAEENGAHALPSGLTLLEEVLQPTSNSEGLYMLAVPAKSAQDSQTG